MEEPKPPFLDLQRTACLLLLAVVISVGFNTRSLVLWAEKKKYGAVRDYLTSFAETMDSLADTIAINGPRLRLERQFDRFVSYKPWNTPAVNPAPIQKQEKSILAKEATKGKVVLAAKKRDTRKVRVKPTVPDPVPQNDNVLILGDSMMYGALGKSLKQMIRTEEIGTPYLRAKVGTGLVRPDYFDWMAETQRLYSGLSFGRAILMLGGNDTQNIQVGRNKYVFGTDGWESVYRRRVHKFVRYICSRTPEVYWVGAPLMRSPRYSKKVQWLNGVVQSVVQGTCVKYVPTVNTLGGRQGYQTYMKAGGKMVKVRLTDGIHLSRAGGQIVANTLIDRIKRNSK